VSEVEGHDLWQRSVLGIAVVSDDTRFVNEVLEKVKNYIDMEREVQILDIKFEIL
jgi:uncharacterized protein YlxP (DUF503 family)